MREILFRGKSLNAGNMVCGDLVCWDNGKVNIHVTMFDDKDKKYKFPVDPETVGQFTGLCDKNGKKIFEGDIVKEADVKHNGEVQIEGKIYEIRMYKGCWVVWNRKAKTNLTRWDFLNTFADTAEIIGNIYENPELLKAGAQNEN